MDKPKYKIITGLTENEFRLILFMRDLKYADVLIPIHAGNPMINGVRVYSKMAGGQKSAFFERGIDELIKPKERGADAGSPCKK